MTDNLDLLAGRQHIDMGLLHDSHLLAREHVHDEASDTMVPVREARELPQAVAVRQKAAKGFNAMTTYVTAGAGPVSLFGEDMNRKKATVSNGSGTNAICVGTRSQVAAGLGYILPAGQQLGTDTQLEMFAGPTPGYAGGAIPVGLFIETD